MSGYGDLDAQHVAPCRGQQQFELRKVNQRLRFGSESLYRLT
jgi:hypothetical protein